ncbi:MAG TPA: hypothetical protein VE646_08550 [Actinomycetota bacterium]|nr:hypothetical protein [Actinomycetota bacterium]
MSRVRMLFLAVALTGCHVGKGVEDFAPATRPEGIEARVVTRNGGRIVGELLAVEDSGLLIRTVKSFVFVPYGQIRQGRFPVSGAPGALDDGRRPGNELERWLRLLSRYPQGVDGDLLERLLAAYGFEEVERLDR